MRKSLILVAATLLAGNVSATAGEFKTDAPTNVTVSGKIKNQQGEPVKGAQVFLIDRESGQKLQAKTDKAGYFKISHDRSEFETLLVIAPEGTGLAQAALSDIPAHDARHVIVSLKPGVLVRGKVISAGKPLKGITVRAIPKTTDIVHDSGETSTNGKGEFWLTITPGEKVFEVIDFENDVVCGLHREAHLITTGGALPNIIVPAQRTAGVNK